jgi:hypothetical protein
MHFYEGLDTWYRMSQASGQQPCFVFGMSQVYIFFKIGIVGGGVQLGPLGTAATNRPIVPAPSDYDDGEIGGMMIGRGNRSTRRKAASVPLCLPQTPYALPGREPGKPVTNRLSYGTAMSQVKISAWRLIALAKIFFMVFIGPSS